MSGLFDWMKHLVSHRRPGFFLLKTTSIAIVFRILSLFFSPFAINLYFRRMFQRFGTSLTSESVFVPTFTVLKFPKKSPN